MWFFKRKHKEPFEPSTNAEPAKIPAWPTSATPETQARLLASSYEFPVHLVIATYSCGIGRTLGTEGIEYPMFNVSVPPGGTLDYANPDEGFVDGLSVPGAAMVLWADDLVTVEREGRWRFLLDSTQPLDERWFRTFDGSGPSRATAALFVVHFGQIPQGQATGADLDALPRMLTTIEDRRHLNVAKP